MISALLYLHYHSTKNRFATRFKRLKQPKYLFGAIVGGIYFYFYFFRYLFHARGIGRAGIPVFDSFDDPLLCESIGALILFLVVLLAWLIPRRRAALAFTEAEVAFLFPAPISRRGLIHFKLLRSQMGVLFIALFFTLMSNRFGSGGKPLLHAAGLWVILSTLNLHVIGSSFAVTMLMDRGISNWQRRLGVLVLVGAALGVVGVWTLRTLPTLKADALANPGAIADYARQVLLSGPMPWLLYPFRLVVRPLFAPDAFGFLSVVWPALLLLGAHYGWVMRSDVAFEEASVEASKKLTERIAAVRAGNWRAGSRKLKSRRAPFKLASVGWPLIALLWKNLIAAGQAFTLRTWIVLASIVVAMSVSSRGVAAGSNWLPAVGMISGMFGVWSVLIGPQLMRQDFRQDLLLVDLLKLYPMRGWQIALGEIFAPAAILTGAQWLLLLVAASVFSQIGGSKFPAALVFAIGLGAVIVVPMLNLISLLIPNAAVLLFPAWFRAGKDAPHGVEAMGQRLIFALGQFLAFAIALIPAVAAFAMSFWILRFMMGVVPAVPVAAVAAALVLAVEAGLGVVLLGWLFERFDVSAEPAA